MWHFTALTRWLGSVVVSLVSGFGPFWHWHFTALTRQVGGDVVWLGSSFWPCLAFHSTDQTVGWWCSQAGVWFLAMSCISQHCPDHWVAMKSGWGLGLGHDWHLTALTRPLGGSGFWPCLAFRTTDQTFGWWRSLSGVWFLAMSVISEH